MSKRSNRKSPRKPGRPTGAPDLRDAILDHAEQLFAERGFAGTKVRDIATAAQVNQALVSYYFGGKQALFDAVFLRRGRVISLARHDLLDALMARTATPTVAELVYCYLKPQWDMKFSGPSGAAFVRLQARLHAELEEHALRLRREVYDESVKRYVQVLSEILPGIPKDVISIRMAFLVGTYMFMLNDLGRINDLTDGQVGEVAKDAMLAHLGSFLTAGLTAPVP